MCRTDSRAHSCAVQHFLSLARSSRLTLKCLIPYSPSRGWRLNQGRYHYGPCCFEFIADIALLELASL